jgi:hypothetical protein
MPQIAISKDTVSIGNHGTYDLGLVATVEPKTIDFTVRNTGEANLTFVTVDNKRINLEDNDSGYFSVAAQPAATTEVAPNGTITFSLAFSPVTVGNNFTATVVIKTNSRNNDEFIFTVKGNSYIKMPQIAISKDTVSIGNHGTYDLGLVATVEPKTIDFTVKNTGEATLTFVTVDNKRINLEDNDSGYFSVAAQPATTTVAPNGTITFSLLFSPVTVGNNFTATVVIKTNSRNNDEFVFIVKGNSYIKTPQITLSQDTTGIENYGEYNFGIVELNETKSVVFTIGNSGEAPLIFTTVDNNRITLTDNVDGFFTVTQQPAASMQVSPGNTVSFTVRFSPTSEGAFSTAVNIKTNSKTGGEFAFTIYGSSAVTNITYNIGDTGPGGGMVFFAEGGVYMECSGELGRSNWSDAVEVAQNHSGGGFTNWHLPTKNELDLMYQNLKRNNLGGFSDEYYWSSTEAGYYTYIQRFIDGYQSYTSPGSTCSVRAVRSF